jgi:hypothetical protein
MTLHQIPLVPVLFAVVVLIVIGVAVWLQRKAGGPDHEFFADFPYRRVETLFAGGEGALLHVLEEAVGTGFRVLAKVRLADLLEIDARPRSARWRRAFARVASQHVDFVVCVRASGRLLGVVAMETGDAQRPAGPNRQRVVEQALALAGIPVVRLEAATRYNGAQIRDQLQRAWGVSLAALRKPAEKASGNRLHCPDCGAPMTAKVVASGPHAGRRYLKCSRFPECRRLVAAEEPSPSDTKDEERPFTMGSPAPDEEAPQRPA